VLTYNLVPEVALAQEMGLCYAGLVTISAAGADRPAPSSNGEVRATLHALAQLLPEFVADANRPRMCGCGALA
jgi:purine nucleoside phosphorylase